MRVSSTLLVDAVSYVEFQLHLIETVSRAGLPWRLLAPEGRGFADLKRKKEIWSPEKPPFQELYARA